MKVQFSNQTKEVVDIAEILNLYRIYGGIYLTSGLKNLSVRVDGQPFKLIQQNPKKQSKWGVLALCGKEVVQVVSGSGKYMGVFVDGIYTKY